MNFSHGLALPPRTRKLRGARVVAPRHVEAQHDRDQYRAEFAVSLGAAPTRGAVWVTPEVRARDGGWFAMRCQGGARNGEIAYSRPGRDGGQDARLRVEFSFDDGRAQVSQDLAWDNVERHWSARLSPAEPMVGWMRDSGVMRVTAEDRPGSDFTLRGASEALSRMYEICG